MVGQHLWLLVSFVICHVFVATTAADPGSRFYDALRDTPEEGALPGDGGEEEAADPAGAPGNRPEEGPDGLGTDQQLFQIAYRFVRQLGETRQSLAALREVLGFLDTDLAQKAQMLQRRYVQDGREMWRLLREASPGAGQVAPSSARGGAKTKKRTCSVNLGGHCATENAVSFANQMRFLSSGLSPGKRRRRSVRSNDN